MVTISLTSHSARFRFLPDAIQELGGQTVTPDRIVINIAAQHVTNLPSFPISSIPVEIQGVDDIGPASKLLPTMQRYPDETIVTVDDDVTYRADLLEDLLEGSRLAPHHVVATMARVIPYFSGARHLPYGLWPYCHTSVTSIESRWLVPLGAEGVLYPPGALHTEAFDVKRLRSLAPTTDDLWLWIHRVTKGTGLHVRPWRPRQPRRFGSDASSLWSYNRAGVNVAVKNDLIDAYLPHGGSPNDEAWRTNLLRDVGRRVKARYADPS